MFVDGQVRDVLEGPGGGEGGECEGGGEEGQGVFSLYLACWNSTFTFVYLVIYYMFHMG